MRSKGSSLPPHGGAVLDRRLEVETPEHVGLSYTLAGPGSRFTAFLIDAALLVLAVAAMAIGAALLVSRLPIQPAVPALTAVFLIVVFVVFWGYFIYFEGVKDGQTPGKRRLGLRVVHDGGHPLTLRGALIRNLIRIIDIQPVPACAVGGLMILLHGRAQRLGDLAAGTIVVRERKGLELPEERASAGPPRLDDDEHEVLSSYVRRRAGLEPKVRDRLALQIVAHFPAHTAEGSATAGGRAQARDADLALTRLHADESGRRAAAGAAGSSGSPAAAALVQRQRERWNEYGALVSQARGRGLASLPEAQVSRFAMLYREIASDLARVRTYGGSPDLVYTLERAVGAGHNLLYARSKRDLRPLGAWLTGGFPRLVRRLRRPIGIAALILVLPGVVAFGAIAAEPARARMLLPSEMIAHAQEGADREASGAGYAQVPEIAMPIFSSRIITNNVQVSFTAFAGGVLAGLGTMLILLFNGMHIGAVFGLYHVEGLNLHLWSFVLPHAVLELTAICFAGGAGLWLGSAILVPGRQSRRRALADRARESVSLLIGAILMLVAAGLIEGFISPAPLPFIVKLTVSLLTAAALYPYLLFGGRGADRDDDGEGTEAIKGARAA